ncbi:hypothetical protein M4D55_23385 [Metabacillus idriensis]|uniref:hypothetical protein n=1 Tax=Metabacillus idriensis TaxID=324768 RepID=UPI00203F38CB|nr:hypothetical protein [Metabacillus idriensis]MCM3598706.1 hypothetical protein [Metabacillus idriensis]
MGTIRIYDHVNHIPEITAKLEQIDGTKIRAGVLGQGKTQMIAGVHEFGITIAVTPKMRGFLASQGLHLKKTTHTIRIPERSFIRAGWDSNEREILDKCEELLKDAFILNVPASAVVDGMGQETRDRIKDYARDLDNPDNHPFTVERKGSDNPLVDTGHMIQSIDYEIG